MELVVGAIVDGKVTGITKFGAFVSLPEGRSGLVHISEIAYTYVNEVSDHLHEGQEVKVKIIGIDQSNRINLSIRQVEPPPQRPPRQGRPGGGGGRPRQGASRPMGFVHQPPKEPTDFATSRRRAETAGAAADAGRSTCFGAVRRTAPFRHLSHKKDALPFEGRPYAGR